VGVAFEVFIEGAARKKERGIRGKEEERRKSPCGRLVLTTVERLSDETVFYGGRGSEAFLSGSRSRRKR